MRYFFTFNTTCVLIKQKKIFQERLSYFKYESKNNIIKKYQEKKVTHYLSEWKGQCGISPF